MLEMIWVTICVDIWKLELLAPSQWCAMGVFGRRTDPEA